MLPRTFLSEPYPWAGGSGVYGGWLPPSRSESFAVLEGLWDTGSELALCSLNHMREYPGWNVTFTIWDRASGALLRRYSPPSGAFGYVLSGLPYLIGLTQSRDGHIWAAFGGAVLAYAPFRYAGFPTEETVSYEIPDHAALWGVALDQARAALPGFDPNTITETNTITPEQASAGSSSESAYLQQSQAGFGPLVAEIIPPNTNVFPVGPPILDAAYTFDALDLTNSDGAFLIVGNGAVLVNAIYASAAVRPPSSPTGLVVVLSGAPPGPVHPIPAHPISIAYDDATRAWVLMDDHTALCVDYVTGEPHAHVWLPYPGPLGGARLAWQRSYRRLLLIAPLASDQEHSAQRHWLTRIAGYSTVPQPVHIVRPIPLRPVRAGRPTPFLIRQVGSLCEPVAGQALLTPAAGVIIDRTVVTLDEEGDAQVMVTASAEGEASFSVSIDVLATWQSPGIATPFGGPPEIWVEGGA